MILLPLSVLVAMTDPLQEPTPAPPPPAHRLDEVVVEAPPANEGEVVLSCAVRRSGQMEDCRVESETPPGRRFGEAALRSARQARIARGDRHAGGERVTFTVRFRLAD
ncbi:TonB family protein [Brevundimonas viscosa]|uniref:TonB family C-terminal domain-containing protein n=1 Tax=Brevundimonas viscosa TaxID=871741 RepID=A0A1I6TMN1_9CAUL|nr:TonB family protein [Brevundimonas viscosa]SFS90445.1 TonB family C-terminal domain-containing protein [Brevundimonas viscosa]